MAVTTDAFDATLSQFMKNYEYRAKNTFTKNLVDGLGGFLRVAERASRSRLQHLAVSRQSAQDRHDRLTEALVAGKINPSAPTPRIVTQPIRTYQHGHVTVSARREFNFWWDASQKLVNAALASQNEIDWKKQTSTLGLESTVREARAMFGRTNNKWLRLGNSGYTKQRFNH